MYTHIHIVDMYSAISMLHDNALRMRTRGNLQYSLCVCEELAEFISSLYDQMNIHA